MGRVECKEINAFYIKSYRIVSIDSHTRRHGKFSNKLSYSLYLYALTVLSQRKRNEKNNKPKVTLGIAFDLIFLQVF